MRNRLYLRIVIPFLTLGVFLVAGSMANAYTYETPDVFRYTRTGGTSGPDTVSVSAPVELTYIQIDGSGGMPQTIEFTAANGVCDSPTWLGLGCVVFASGQLAITEGVTTSYEIPEAFTGKNFAGIEVHLKYEGVDFGEISGDGGMYESYDAFYIATTPSGGGSTPLTEAVSGTYMVSNSLIGGLWSFILSLLPLIAGFAVLGFVMWGVQKLVNRYKEGYGSGSAWIVTNRDKKNNLKMLEKAYKEGQKK